MPTTIPSVTPYPDPAPDRTDRANFRARAISKVTHDILLAGGPETTGELNASIAAMNTVAGEMNEIRDDVVEKADIVTYQAGIATAAAVTSVNAPGTHASSITELTIGTGAKTLVIETEKSIIPGMFLIIASMADLSNFMSAQVVSYNSGTGILGINSVIIGGFGTYSDWVVHLSVPPSLIAETQRSKQAFLTAFGV